MEKNTEKEILNKKYDEFFKYAQITQQLKLVMRNTNNWLNLTPSQKECLEMIAFKIGRILNGDLNYKDAWIDMIGYIQVIVDFFK